MNEKKAVKPMFFAQIEEVLEERQTPDRRREDLGVPEQVGQDRRKEDRRTRQKR